MVRLLDVGRIVLVIITVVVCIGTSMFVVSVVEPAMEKLTLKI
jgi:hypothetical protein